MPAKGPAGAIRVMCESRAAFFHTAPVGLLRLQYGCIQTPLEHPCVQLELPGDEVVLTVRRIVAGAKQHRSCRNFGDSQAAPSCQDDAAALYAGGGVRAAI